MSIILLKYYFKSRVENMIFVAIFLFLSSYHGKFVNTNQTKIINLLSC